MAEQVQIEAIRVKMCMGWDVDDKIEVSSLLEVRMCPMCGSNARELHMFWDGQWYSSYDVGGETIICCMSLDENQLKIETVLKPENMDMDEQHYLYTEFGVLMDDDDDEDTL